MKPCSKNKKLIAWLATDALPAAQANELRRHIAACAGCRSYFDETIKLVRLISPPPPPAEVEFSPSFHRRLVRALAAETRPSFGRTWSSTSTGSLRAAWLNWRLALPVLIAVAAIGIALFVSRWHPRQTQTQTPIPVAPQAIARANQLPVRAVDLSPTFLNYQMAAEKSPDALEELLTAQARRNPVPAPLYTASTANLLD